MFCRAAANGLTLASNRRQFRCRDHGPSLGNSIQFRGTRRRSQNSFRLLLTSPTRTIVVLTTYLSAFYILVSMHFGTIWSSHGSDFVVLTHTYARATILFVSSFVVSLLRRDSLTSLEQNSVNTYGQTCVRFRKTSRKRKASVFLIT